MNERDGAGNSGADILAARVSAGLPGREAGGRAAARPECRPDAEIMPRMGGIALKNGLVFVSEDYWAAAVRETDGHISVASGRKPRLPSGRGRRAPVRTGLMAVAERSGARVGSVGALRRVPPGATGGHAAAAAAGGARARAQVADMEGLPMLRGLARFGETLLVLAQVKVRLPQAELPLEGGRVVAALAAAYAATSTVRALGPKSAIVQETGAALAAFVPAVVSLRNSAISGYHGAEHKVIAGQEAEFWAAAAGSPGLTPQPGFPAGGYSAAASAPKEHDRCGSNLVGPLLFTTVAANLIIRGAAGRMTPAGSAVAGAVSLGAAIEALRWATRHGDSLAARLMLSPGRIVQKTLTTSEPTPEQLEVAQRAMKELLRVQAAGA